MQTHKAYDSDLQHTYDQAKAFSYRLQDPLLTASPAHQRFRSTLHLARAASWITRKFAPEGQLQVCRDFQQAPYSAYPGYLTEEKGQALVFSPWKPSVCLLGGLSVPSCHRLTSLRSTITSTHHINFASSTARVPVQCYQGNLSVPMLKRAHMNDYIEYVNVQCWSIIYVVVLIFFLGFSEGP